MPNKFVFEEIFDGDGFIDSPEGGVDANFKTDHTLTFKDGVLSVNTVDKMNDETADNTLPITASAVNVTVGNIEVLLKTI